MAVASANAYFPHHYPAAHVSATRAGGNFAYSVNAYPQFGGYGYPYGYPVAAFPAVKPVEAKEFKPTELKAAPFAYPYAGFPYAAYPYAAGGYGYPYAYPVAAPSFAAAEKPAEDKPAVTEA